MDQQNQNINRIFYGCGGLKNQDPPIFARKMIDVRIVMKI